LNQTHSEHDYLIVGAGLAGSILTWQLIHHGLKVCLLHDPSIPAASRAAAGLINPVTGQRLVLQENIDALLHTARKLYGELEKAFNIKLLHEKKMLRLFRNEKEQSAWEKRRHDESYLPFIASELCRSDGFYQFQTGHLDTNLLLDHLHRSLQQRGTLIEGCFDPATPGNQSIIFCEGWRAQHNPWFNWLPFQPAKGEILTFKTTGQLPEQIVNRGKWLLSTTASSFKLGATYEWQQLDETITENAVEELSGHLSKLYDHPDEAELTGHVAGVRPGTKDKHPFIGRHPDHANLFIFNGFGSKGSLLIPWYAERFAEHLTNQTPLPPEADIQRFADTLHG